MSLYARNSASLVGGGGGGGGISLVGTFDSQSPVANAAVIVSSSIFFQSADATHPGMVNIGSQSFAGQKTFQDLTSFSSNAISAAWLVAGAGIATIQLPTGLATSYEFNLPIDGGTTGYLLTSSGGVHNTNMTWTDPTSIVPTQIPVTRASTNAAYYLTFINGNTTGNYALDVGTGLSFNPSTNNLSTTTFTGALVGNASTATAATTATNLAGGLGGSVPYQSAAGTTAMLANGSSGQVLTSAGTTLAPTWQTPATGTVTSVGMSVPAASLFSVGGSPVTTSGTLALSTAGTSGGIPYFSSTSQLNSSALLAANGVVLGGGAGVAPATLATASSTAFPLVSGGTGVAPSWAGLTIAGGGTSVTSVTTAPTATAFAGWDANKNLSANNLIDGFTTQATAASTLTMTIASTSYQYFTGSTASQVVKLPTTSVVAGQQYTIVNLSSQTVAVQSSGANAIQTLAANSQAVLTAVVATPTTAANWSCAYNLLAGGGSGTVTSVTFTGDGTFLSSTPSAAVTTSGTVTAALKTQTANTILAGPTSGSAANPTFRAQVPADRPLVTVSKTTTYTATAAEDIILCSGSAFTVTLPAASVTGKQFIIKKTDSSTTNIITIARAGSDTIDGATSTTLNTQYETITIVSDGGTSWSVINRTYPQSFVAYTPTFTGFGTAASVDFVSRRVGDSLEIQGKFTSGTPTGVEARISLGYGGTDGNVTSAASPKIGGIRIAGDMTFSTNGAAYIIPYSLVETSVGYLTVGASANATAPLTKQNANGLVANGYIVTVNALVPITGWN